MLNDTRQAKADNPTPPGMHIAPTPDPGDASAPIVRPLENAN